MRNKNCAYCGVFSKRPTRDHVVHRAFWAASKMPLNSITVPSCVACHKKWDEDATYLRNLLVVQASDRDHEAVMPLFHGPVLRRVRKSYKDHYDLTRDAFDIWLPSGSGKYELRTRIPVDSRYVRALEKIVRGLHYHLVKKNLPVDCDVRVMAIESPKFFKDIQPVVEKMHPWWSTDDGLFRFRSNGDPSRALSCWLLLFFNKVGFICWTQPKDYQIPIASAP